MGSDDDSARSHPYCTQEVGCPAESKIKMQPPLERTQVRKGQEGSGASVVSVEWPGEIGSGLEVALERQCEGLLERGSLTFSTRWWSSGDNGQNSRVEVQPCHV